MAATTGEPSSELRALIIKQVCSREECVEEWLKYSGGTTPDQQEDQYDSGSYGLQHCERKGCHDIYFRGKNGEDCNECGRRYCEDCSCRFMSSCNDDDPFDDEVKCDVCRGQEWVALDK